MSVESPGSQQEAETGGVRTVDWLRSLYGYCRRCNRPRVPWRTDEICRREAVDD